MSNFDLIFNSQQGNFLIYLIGALIFIKSPTWTYQPTQRMECFIIRSLLDFLNLTIGCVRYFTLSPLRRRGCWFGPGGISWWIGWHWRPGGRKEWHSGLGCTWGGRRWWGRSLPHPQSHSGRGTHRIIRLSWLHGGEGQRSWDGELWQSPDLYIFYSDILVPQMSPQIS